MGKGLSVIIPCYNEASRGDFQERLRKVYDYLEYEIRKFELILVNDGSSDRTAEEIIKFSDGRSSVRVASYGKNKGKGYAVKVGVLKSNMPYVLYMDADLSVDLHYIKSFLNEMESGVCLVGSRRVKDSKIVVDQSAYRRKLGNCCRFLVSRIFNQKIRDTQCGFKMFNTLELKHIVHVQRINGWMFDVEYLYLASMIGVSVKELGIAWKNNKISSVSRFGSIVTSVFDLIRIRLSKRHYKNWLCTRVRSFNN